MPKQSICGSGETVSLVAAAARARMKYARMLNHILCGDVIGRQEDGRWIVEADDLDRFIRERQGTLPTAA